MSPEKRDYYEILGVSRDATSDDLRSAFRKLARQYHPDVSKEPDAETRFKEINEAYQVLNDQEQRARYDRFGHAGVDQNGMGAGGFGFGGFEDIFGDLFGFGMREAGRRGPRRGADLRYDLEITFEEAVFGCEREIEIARAETCAACHGSGAEPGTTPMRCPDCGGTGQIRRSQQSIFGSFINVTTCPRCEGKGEVITTPCAQCHGSGQVQQVRKLAVQVPPGVDDEMRIRLAGEGAAGSDGGPAGNLYVLLHVKPHEFFRRRGDDILLNININIAQAALGDEIDIPTLGQPKKLRIPAGTQTGAVFRLRGEGVQKLRGNSRGDEIVVVNVAVPTELDAEQRRLLMELGKSLGHDIMPRGEKSFFERLRDVLGV